MSQSPQLNYWCRSLVSAPRFKPLSPLLILHWLTIRTHLSRVVRYVQCFTVKWFNCTFGNTAQCSSRWIIKSSPLRFIYIFLLSISFLSGLTEQRFAGEIWLRDRLIWLPASRSMLEIFFSLFHDLSLYLSLFLTLSCCRFTYFLSSKLYSDDVMNLARGAFKSVYK